MKWQRQNRRRWAVGQSITCVLCMAQRSRWVSPRHWLRLWLLASGRPVALIVACVLRPLIDATNQQPPAKQPHPHRIVRTLRACAWRPSATSVQTVNWTEAAGFTFELSPNTSVLDSSLEKVAARHNTTAPLQDLRKGNTPAGVSHLCIGFPHAMASHLKIFPCPLEFELAGSRRGWAANSGSKVGQKRQFV